VIGIVSQVTNRSPPIWEIGDVVNVLEEWENITR
jgi:hypothetical protein